MDLMKMDFAKFEARVMANTCAAMRRTRRRRILREIAAVLLYAGLCALLIFWATGCSGTRVDGFSVGVILLRSEVTTSTKYGEQHTNVEGIAPIFLVNVKFD